MSYPKILITILRNEALVELSKITDMTTAQLVKRIINRMTLEELLDPYENMPAGSSLFQQAEKSGYTAFKLKALLFPCHMEAQEINELLNAVYFWGLDEENPCPECGCFMDQYDHDNDGDGNLVEITQCTNFECKHKEFEVADNEDNPTYLSAL